jgi:SHS2 domain-containing protein
VTEPSAGWEHFDVEADVGIRAWGPTRAAAFEQATLGTFALIVTPDDVLARDAREVRAQGDSPERLLVNWINECLYVHEIEGFVAREVVLSVATDRMVAGTLRGEDIDGTRHRLGTIVKAATMHQIAVEESGNRHEVRLIVDV